MIVNEYEGKYEGKYVYMNKGEDENECKICM